MEPKTEGQWVLRLIQEVDLFKKQESIVRRMREANKEKKTGYNGGYYLMVDGSRFVDVDATILRIKDCIREIQKLRDNNPRTPQEELITAATGSIIDDAEQRISNYREYIRTS